MFRTNVVAKIKALILYQITFLKFLPVLNSVWKYGIARQVRDDKAIIEQIIQQSQK
jgi:hypothetical protein